MKISIRIPRAAPLVDDTPPVQFASRPETFPGLRLGFLDNTKPNSDKLLKRLSERIKKEFSPGDMLHRRKADSSSPAAAALLEELADRCDLVINAVPD